MAYKLYCRECEWKVSDPVELKGEANLRAGRHISETGHSVALKEVDADGPEDPDGIDGDFYRDSGSVELLRPGDVAVSTAE